MKTKFKRHKVVMLSTNEKAKLGELHLSYYDLAVRKPEYGNVMSTSRHLYFLSDEEIKEGDWCVNYNLDTLYQIYDISKDYNPNNDWYKVIASTDKLLGSPQPSQAFIEKFISEYNKGNQITEVMVEYEITDIMIGGGDAIQTKLKVDSNNTITIKKVKDSRSREEVEELLFEYSKFANNIFDTGKAISVKDHNDWIEKNL